MTKRPDSAAYKATAEIFKAVYGCELKFGNEPIENVIEALAKAILELADQPPY